MSKILLIENTGFIRIKFGKTLKEHGMYDNNTTSSQLIFTVQHLHLIKEADLIFIDCDNRDIDPDKIIPEVKSLSSGKTLIISITNKTTQQNISHLFSLGSDDVLVKPYSDIKLMEKIFSKLGHPTLLSSDTKVDVVSTNGKRCMPKWSGELALGIDSIDNEHKSLIESYEKLYQNFKRGEGKEYCHQLIDYMENYVVTHFNHEEAFLDKIQYSELSDHKTYHLNFTKQLSEIAEQSKNGEITNEMMIRFSLFIKNWWLHHILIEDKKYIDFYHDLNNNPQK